MLPAIATAAAPAAIIPRMIRSSMLEVLNQGYIRVARAKGVPWCIGCSLEKLLPIIELSREFGDFLNDPDRERLRGWQIAFFSGFALWGWVLGLVLVAAMSGLTQTS